MHMIALLCNKNGWHRYLQAVNPPKTVIVAISIQTNHDLARIFIGKGKVN